MKSLFFLHLIFVLFSSCATKQTGVRRQIDFMGGTQTTKKVPTNEAEKSGYFFGLRYYKGLQTKRLGQYGWALGMQETHQDGKTSTNYQLLINRSGFFDLSFYLPSGENRFLLGVLYRTFIGQGVQYGMDEKTRWQSLSLLGPQLQKLLGDRLVLGVALLHSHNFEKRSIVQMPIYFGWKF